MVVRKERLVPAPLTGILETVLYCTAEDEDDTRRFYDEVLQLHRVSHWTYRLGSHLFLLFNSEETKTQEWPPTHGAVGSGHICFTVTADAFDPWKRYLEDEGVELIEEIDWSRGIHSFYFCDPAGNVLEIANGDMWPS